MPAHAAVSFRQLIFALLFCPTLVCGQVAIEQSPGPFHVTAHGYKATIEPDGCLTQLSIHGKPFLAPNVSISRGSYFYFNGPLRLPRIHQPNDHTLVAEGDLAKVQYKFGESLEWILTSTNTEDMVFFLVLDKGVSAMRDEDGKWHSAIVSDSGKSSTWFHGTSTMAIRGSQKFWGPWHEHQVVEVHVPSNQAVKLRIDPGQSTEADRRHITEAFSPQSENSNVIIRSPLNYQVFQRDSRESGTIRLSGRARFEFEQVECRLAGSSDFGALPKGWLKVPCQTLAGAVSNFYSGTRGWLVRNGNSGKDNTGNVLFNENIEHFGVGEVFVGAGQSNSTNCGEFKTSQSSGMVASFGGNEWKIANDPQLGVADHSTGGSFWPAFGDRMYAELKVPIGVATNGFGGTSVNQWNPKEHLFQWFMTRVGQLGPGGFRAVLWHQGESDVYMDSEEYYRKLKNIIQASKSTAGWEFPWFVAQVSYHNPQQTRFESTRSAQARLWMDGVALEGPDTDTLTGDHRDLKGQGIHFSPKGLKAHGEMWAEKLLPLLVQPQ